MFISSAQATINVTLAEVQNGLAVVEGNKAAKNTAIIWESTKNVGNTNKGGSFSFSSLVPADCNGSLTIGGETIDVALANCTSTPEPSGGVFKTGQTTCYDSVGAVIASCANTGQDGEFQAGATVPNPRFTDNANGTVTDHLTGLTWPKDLDCVGGNNTPNWANALAAANALADGNVACGLTDGSVTGDWRLPNRNELTSLLDLGTFNPALPALNPFQGFIASLYWSSTTIATNTEFAWGVNLDNGFVVGSDVKTNGFNFVTAVRGGS